MRALVLALLSIATIYGQGGFFGKDPRWQTVGAGTLADRPAACVTNRDVWICNGAGCTTNGEYHYCTAPNVWTAMAGGGAPTTGQYLTLTADGTLTQERVFTPRDMLAVTDAGAGATYTLDFDPLDLRLVEIREEFIGGTCNTSAQIGKYGWQKILGATWTCVSTTAWPNLGVLQLVTGATSGNLAGTTIETPSGGSQLPLGALGSNAPWRAKWIFSVPATTTVGTRVGLASGCDTATGGNQFALRYDTSSGDTNFLFVVRNGGTEYTYDTGVAINTAKHTLWIAAAVTGTIQFRLDTDAVVSSADPGWSAAPVIPTTGMDACALVVTRDNVARTLNVDAFTFSARVSSGTERQ